MSAWPRKPAKRRWPISCFFSNASRLCAPRTRMCARSRSAAAGGLALIRCDGGGSFGYGHVKRMVALARALRDREGLGSIFAVHGSDDALQPIARAGFEATLVDGTNDLEALGAMIANRSPDMLICDLREGLDRADLARLGKRVTLTAVIDDGSPRRLAADYAYYPPVPQAERLDWSGSRCERRIGWQWAILGQGKPATTWPNASGRTTLLVTMGGSDPQNLTHQMRACARQARSDIPRALRHRTRRRQQGAAGARHRGARLQFRNAGRRGRIGDGIRIRRCGAHRLRRDGLRTRGLWRAGDLSLPRRGSRAVGDGIRVGRHRPVARPRLGGRRRGDRQCRFGSAERRHAPQGDAGSRVFRRSTAKGLRAWPRTSHSIWPNGAPSPTGARASSPAQEACAVASAILVA